MDGQACANMTALAPRSPPTQGEGIPPGNVLAAAAAAQHTGTTTTTCADEDNSAGNVRRGLWQESVAGNAPHQAFFLKRCKGSDMSASNKHQVHCLLQISLVF